MKAISSRQSWGLSPRMRGNPGRSSASMLTPGSIPAYAGEPVSLSSLPLGAGVYPRVCGGTTAALAKSREVRGLSPRMRGNRRGGVPTGHDVGSIPAYAGEPDAIVRARKARWVYPRVCGGTFAASAPVASPLGLSPRMRGNLPDTVHRRECHGSIPAYAGEPVPACRCAPARWVYPRVCGGTVTMAASTAAKLGLSPRMRGNHRHFVHKAKEFGSIPAYAGEPILLIYSH